MKSGYLFKTYSSLQLCARVDDFLSTTKTAYSRLPIFLIGKHNRPSYFRFRKNSVINASLVTYAALALLAVPYSSVHA